MFLVAELIIVMGFSVVYYIMAITGSGSDASAFEIQSMYADLIRNNAVIITLLSAVLIIAFSVWMLKNDEKRLKYNILYKELPIPAYAAAAIMGAAFCVGLNFFFSIIDIYSMLGHEEGGSVLFGGNIVLAIITICIVTPLAEELVFRNLFYKRLREYASFLPAALLSSLMFAVYHLDVIQGIYAFITGMALAFIFEKTDFVVVPFLFHAAANTTSYILSYMITDAIEQRIMVIVIFSCFLISAAGILYFAKKVQVGYSLKEIPEQETPVHDEEFRSGREYINTANDVQDLDGERPHEDVEGTDEMSNDNDLNHTL